MPQYGIQAMGMLSVHNHSNLTQGGAVPLGSLSGHNKPPHDALAIDAGQVDGIEGAEILQRNGSVPLTVGWDAGGFHIRALQLQADWGGLITLGNNPGSLTLERENAETMKILGMSNNPGGLKLSDAIISGKLQLTAPTELTINAGAITITGSYHRVDGQGDAADNLDTINGGMPGQLLMLQIENVGRPITVREVGNVSLEAVATYLMDTTRDKILLFYDSISARWIHLGGLQG